MKGNPPLHTGQRAINDDASSRPGKPAKDAAPLRPARWLARPGLSALLAVVWLLLQQSLALPQLIAAAVIGLVVPRLVHGLLPPRREPRRVRRVALQRLGVAVRLAGIVLLDIVMSNLTVARIVLSPESTPQPAWVRVALDIEDPLAITLLATIITMTPGTVSCVVDEARREIVVHALDCTDAPAMAQQIKHRYERPLKELLG